MSLWSKELVKFKAVWNFAHIDMPLQYDIICTPNRSNNHNNNSIWILLTFTKQSYKTVVCLKPGPVARPIPMPLTSLNMYIYSYMH